MKKILLIDDDPISRTGLGELVSTAGFSPLEAGGGKEGVSLFEEEDISAVLLDLVMPDMDGLATLNKLKAINPTVPIIMVTAHGDVSTAVKATKLGAYDFILKPPGIDHFVLTLQRAVERMALQKEVDRLHTIVDSTVEKLIGRSESIKKIQEQILKVADSDFTVIIQGETGTGKTTLARGVHELSKRSQNPFVKVDIGTLSESLIESELFGHEKGSFTGAHRKKKGFFEAAHGGTIFIDEIENLSLPTQCKLLNVVEEKKIYPVGSNKWVEIDFRIIAATNKDIRKLVQEKKIRQDLFYRLSEYIIDLPPLRERIEDIRHFAWKFLEEARDELNRPVDEISEEAMECLTRYSWPGNIRELKNVTKKLVLFSKDRIIKGQQVKNMLCEGKGGLDISADLPLKEALRTHEKNIIKKALARNNGNKTRAASQLQTSYKNLYTKIKEYGLEK